MSPHARVVRVGLRLSLRLVPRAVRLAFRTEAMELSVVHQDRAIFVINKPAGLVVHPAPGHWTGTLLNGLLALDARASHLPRAGIVHRLDKDTSGRMVVARSLEAMTALVRDLSQHEVRRHYAAMVWGVPPESRFKVEAPIGRDPISRIKMAVVASGKPARTALKFGGQKINLRPYDHSTDSWIAAADCTPGTQDLCFIVTVTSDQVARHFRDCGVTILEGPVEKTGALGQMTSCYTRDPEGNLIEVSSYSP